MRLCLKWRPCHHTLFTHAYSGPTMKGSIKLAATAHSLLPEAWPICSTGTYVYTSLCANSFHVPWLWVCRTYQGPRGTPSQTCSPAHHAGWLMTPATAHLHTHAQASRCAPAPLKNGGKALATGHTQALSSEEYLAWIPQDLAICQVASRHR